MRVILWAAVTANGTYMHGGSGYQWPTEVFADFGESMAKAGNCVLGRKTYEEYASSGGSFGNADVVVLSHAIHVSPQVITAHSPQEAVKILEEYNYHSMLIGGGDSVLNAFFQAGIANELILNITPELAPSGSQLAISSLPTHAMKLIDSRELGAGVVRLHYHLS